MAKRRPNPELFYQLIDEGWAGTTAAIEAGYSRRTARQQAYALKAKRPATEAPESAWTDPGDVRDWHASGHCAQLSLPEWITAGRPNLPPGQLEGSPTPPEPRISQKSPPTEISQKSTQSNEQLTEAKNHPEFQPSPEPTSLPQLQNITGDPHGRPDWPINPEASWSQFEQQREEEAATRRWLISQIEGHHE